MRAQIVRATNIITRYSTASSQSIELTSPSIIFAKLYRLKIFDLLILIETLCLLIFICESVDSERCTSESRNCDLFETYKPNLDLNLICSNETAKILDTRDPPYPCQDVIAYALRNSSIQCDLAVVRFVFEMLTTAEELFDSLRCRADQSLHPKTEVHYNNIDFNSKSKLNPNPKDIKNLQMLAFTNITIENKSQMKNFSATLLSVAKSAKRVELNSIRTNESLPEKTIVNEEMNQLLLRNSSFGEFATQAIEITNVEQFIYDRVEFKRKSPKWAFKLNFGSSQSEDKQERIFALYIRNSKVDENLMSTLEAQIIIIGKTQVTLVADLKGNNLEQTISEQVFGKLAVNDKFSNKTFRFEPIDCCSESNAWLFATLRAENDRLETNCTDLNLRDAQELLGKSKENFEAICQTRESGLGLILSLVAIGALMVSLALFSIVYIFYVLPKRQQEGIILNSTRGHIVEVSDVSNQTQASSAAASADTLGGAKTTPLRLFSNTPSGPEQQQQQKQRQQQQRKSLTVASNTHSSAFKYPSQQSPTSSLGERRSDQRARKKHTANAGSTSGSSKKRAGGSKRRRSGSEPTTGVGNRPSSTSGKTVPSVLSSRTLTSGKTGASQAQQQQASKR